ncbi:MAG: c-type cytochrome, partial [Burkholderiaceae bacterium]
MLTLVHRRCSGRFLTLGAIAAFTLAAPLSPASADGTGWFTPDQAQQGRWAYGQHCATCHGPNRAGSGAPALKGTSFNAQWNGKTLQQFYSYVHNQMPLGAAGSLKGQDYVNVVAFILAQSGVPAGNTKLTIRSPMDRVLVLSDTQTAAGPGAGAGGGVPAGAVQLNVALVPVKQPTTTGPTQAELDGADASTTNWLMYNKGYRGERYSTLAKVNAGNVSRLRPVCMYQLGELGTFSTGPVMYDGIVYATTH